MQLTPEQSRAVDTIDSNLQIVACAGSGKTEVITRRIANILKKKPEISPKEIVAFTFTEKAAESMKARISKAMAESGYHDMEAIGEMYVGTIHGFCNFALSEHGNMMKKYKILDTVKNHLFIRRYYDECGMSDLGLNKHLNDIKMFRQCIDKMVDDYDNRWHWEELHQTVFEKYRACLNEHGYLDFALLILEMVEQIKSNPAVTEFVEGIKYLVVDEYQDVDDLQEKLIRLFSESGANICVVGDDDQTIYQFRGSNANNMIEFTNNYPNVTQVKMEKNYRCTEGVVDIADHIIKNNINRIDKKMTSDKSGFDKPQILAKEFYSAEGQYYSIASSIKWLAEDGVEFNDMAVHVRKGKFIAPICEELEKRHIPYITDSSEYFFEGDYFSRLSETLKILTDIDKALLYEVWGGRVSDELFEKGFKYLRRIARNGGDGYRNPLSGIIRGFLETIGLAVKDSDNDSDSFEYKNDDLPGFLYILDDYDEIYKDWQLTARIKGVLNFLEKHAADEYKYHNFKSEESMQNGVQVMTVHKSKGLEFHTVFLPNMMAKEFPVSSMGGRKYWHILGGTFSRNKEKYESDEEDERKLFYVAVTRAKRNLFMYYELSDNKRMSIFVAETSRSYHISVDPDDVTIAKMSPAEIRELKKKITDDIFGLVSSGLGAPILDYDKVRKASLKELLKLARSYGHDV